jgi:hypothetical protein
VRLTEQGWEIDQPLVLGKNQYANTNHSTDREDRTQTLSVRGSDKSLFGEDKSLGYGTLF